MVPILWIFLWIAFTNFYFFPPIQAPRVHDTDTHTFSSWIQPNRD